VQAAAAGVLEAGVVVRAQIAERVTTNYLQLQAGAAGARACRVLKSEGGWYAVVQVPSLQPEEDLVLDLLTRDRVLVHPGYFFDFPRESYLTLSLLPASPTFVSGVGCILQRFAHVERV
jgi:aspartate/methionine/tyrosine aminotransferase